ncbi:MAG TPA: rhodanese-like domain-containing protein [Saprospiraceae bacterium]|nr:rhodanese-like domain-containing protein [Saprospiraceae bacterium]HPI06459.1 rhodanese-like domain-containing protein [Saprospiraceae bacterium]
MDITVQELRQKLESGEKFIFIDVREPYEYEEFNLGAQLIPLGTIGQHIDDLSEHKDEEIVVHCRSGARSNQAKMLLESMGFSNVRNTLGGVLAWREAYGDAKV